MEADALTGDTFVEAPIETAGAYAFVVGDLGATVPPPPVVGDALLSVEPVEVFFGLSATSEVSPAVSPVSPEAMAEGSVVLFSPVTLPSGTLISARVEETFESFSEGTLISEPFSQEMPLYRFPLRSDEELHQVFPVTPSRAFTLEELREGRIHVALGTAPSFVQGALVGGEGFVVTGEGDAELVVPAGALTSTVTVSVEATDPLEVGIGFEGLTLVASAEVDLSGAALSTPGALSVPVSLASPDNLFAARFLFVAGQRKLRLIGEASFSDDRIANPIDEGGTYLFFQSAEPLALVQGTVTEAGSPANLVVVESSTSPFMDITGSSGGYVVAAKLEETTLTARSLVTGNQAVATVTPIDTTPLNVDLVLSTTGPFVTEVRPANGAKGTSLAPAIVVTFSEPVDPNTVSTSTFTLTKSDTTPVPGRIVMGASNLSASYLPDDNLESITGYVINATAGILDTTGNPLLPFTSSFTTLDDSIPELNPDALSISFPNADGIVTIQAPAFSFEPDAAVTILNVTNGIVVTGNVASDGSLFFEIRAAITHEIQIRVVDSSDREIVIDKTEFVGPNGEVAIGRKGGRISSGDFELEVPAGALTGAPIFTLTPVDQAVIDALPLADGAGGLGSAVEVSMGGAVLTEEAEVRFPIPPAAPADAEHAIVRKLEEQGQVLYEVIDTATVVGGKLQTESPPFLGVLSAGFYMSVWYPPLPGPSPNPMGAITGIAREIDTSATSPEERVLPGVTVRVDEALQGGQYVATTNDEGRFVLFDAFFGSVGPTVNLLATDSQGREVRAVAFEDDEVISRFVTLARFARAGDVVFDFPLTPPPPPRTLLTIRLFNKDGESRTEITDGFATVGDELIVKLEFTQPPGEGTVKLEVNDESVAVVRRADELTSIAGEDRPLFVFEGEFTPSEARAYRVEAEGRDAFLNLTSQRKSFLAVQAGAGNDEPLDGNPAIISDSAVPRNGDEGVPVTQVMSVQFTEPVTNVSESTVTLSELPDEISIPIDLVATRRDGTAGVPTPSDEIVALTMTPRRGLKFGTDYRLSFSTAIVDLPSPNQPSPLPLDAETNEILFKTFTPAKLGEAPLEGNLVAMTTIDSLALVALQPPTADGSTGELQVFDLSDPTRPLKQEEDSLFIGSMVRDIAVEERVLLPTGERDVASVLSFNPRSGNGGLTLFDVSSRRSPFPYTGFVTTVVPGEGSNYQVDLHEEFAYVAIGSGGLKIVNLAEASRLFQAELTGNEEPVGFGAIPFSVSQGLFTRGVGFGRAAIQNQLTITDPAAGGSGNLTLTTVAVSGTDQDRLGYVGGISFTDGVGRFSTVGLENVPTTTVHATIELKTQPDPVDGTTRHMSQPSDTALTEIAAQTIAVLAGGPMVQNGAGTLAIVDVTSFLQPELRNVIELEGGWGTHLAIDDDGVTVFVSTTERDTGEVDAEGKPIIVPAQVEIYNLTDPADPLFSGAISTISGDVDIVRDLLVSADAKSSLKTAAVAPGAFITEITPTGVTEQAPDAFVTSRPVNIEFLLTDDFGEQIVSCEVHVLRDNVLDAILPAVIGGSAGTAIWAAASVVDLNAVYTATALVTLAGGVHIASAVQPVPILSFDLSIDGDSTLFDEVGGVGDGVENYLPGQEGIEASNIVKKLLTDGSKKRFTETAFQPQRMRLVTSPLPRSIDSVTFSIESVTSLPGYSGSTSSPAIEGVGKEHDFSFDSESDDISEEGVIDGIRAIVDFYCKDYGGKAVELPSKGVEMK